MTNDYIKAIKDQAATPTEIKPIQKIINNEVQDSSLFQVQQLGKNFIYKISDPNTSLRNLILAQKLLENNICVPNTKIYISKGIYFEKYEPIPGTTLSEFIKYNLWGNNQNFINAQIERVLHDVLVYDKKISEIKLNNEILNQQLVLCERRRHHHKKDFGKILAEINYIINKKQTTYGRVTLHHADLNLSNVLLDKTGNLTALLDLDSLALCDEYTMLTQILTYWPNISVDKLTDIYKSVFNYDLNKRHLKYLIRYKTVRTKVSSIIRKFLQKNK